MADFRLNTLHPGAKIIVIAFFLLICIGLMLSMNTASKSVKMRASKAKAVGLQPDQFFNEDDKFLHFKDAHVHLYGHALVFFAVASVFIFSGAKEISKILVAVLMLVSLLAHSYGVINIKVGIEIASMVLYSILLVYMMLVSLVAMYREESKD